jgi:arginase
VSVIYLPYHLDEHLPNLNVPLPADVTEFSTALPEADVWTRLAALYDAVGGVVQRTVEADSEVTVVSGDCTLSIGMTAGLQRAGVDPSIVWVDAHGDLQSLETTPSGYLGGMALRLLLGYRHDLIADRLALRPPDPSRVLLVDGRDLDPAEVDYATSARLTRSSLGDLTAEDLPAGPFLLNFDLDVLDPAALPGLRYPAQNGPDPEAVLAAAQTILGTGRAIALNLACTWQPGQNDPSGARNHLVSSILAIRAQT